MQVRFLVQCEKWDQLLALLDGLTIPSHMVHDEVVMARQEYLTGALEEATRSLDQAVLKKCLAMATGAGMLPCEKPVYQALQVFIDPPEYVINLPKELKPGTPYELGPDADGQIVLTVKVRGSQNLHWTKNGIALKEGADGGRIKGVETPVLTITKMLGRDEGMKLQCIAKNKFGTVKSNEVKVRTHGGRALERGGRGRDATGCAAAAAGRGRRRRRCAGRAHLADRPAGVPRRFDDDV